MKIVHVLYAFCAGGLETMLVDITRIQAESHEVHLVVVNDVVDDALLATVEPRVRIHRLGRKEGSRNPWPVVRLNALIRQLRPDIVHTHHASMAKYIWCGPRPFLTLHALEIDLNERARKAHLIAISQAVAEDVEGRYPGVRVEAVAPNGIDTDKIARRPGGGAHRPVKAVQVARFDYEKKGQDILIEALKILNARGLDVEATVIGGAQFENIPRLEKMAADAGVADRFHAVRGMSRAELYGALSGFDLMVHPARWEGFGLAIAEGMAAGLPVVIPDEGGPYEVADNGRLAETFRKGDAEGCADAIARVVDAYAQALATAGLGRRHVIEHYSLRRMVEQYERAYREAGAPGPRVTFPPRAD